MEVTITGLRLLIGLFLVCTTFGVLIPYFARPEDFFIKRLRPRSNHVVTHAQLLVRAFIGGLISSALHALGYVLLIGLSLELWLALTLAGGLVLGMLGYAYFRIVRYRRLASNERQPMAEAGEGGFVRREP